MNPPKNEAYEIPRNQAHEMRNTQQAARYTEYHPRWYRTHVSTWWSLFSAGGVFAAFVIPVHLFLLGLAFPLGWIPAPGYQYLHALVTLPLTRIYLFALCFLALFHWAHRFRYTLYDGLQIKHLNELIFVCCYGGAISGTVLAGWLWNRAINWLCAF